MATCIPQRLAYKNQYIITTAQLADLYGTDSAVIARNFNRNKYQYREGEEYFVLRGKAKNEFLRQSQMDFTIKSTSAFYIWTEYGALNHCRSLRTPEADAVFAILCESYFRVITAQLGFAVRNGPIVYYEQF